MVPLSTMLPEVDSPPSIKLSMFALSDLASTTLEDRLAEDDLLTAAEEADCTTAELEAEAMELICVCSISVACSAMTMMVKTVTLEAAGCVPVSVFSRKLFSPPWS